MFLRAINIQRLRSVVEMTASVSRINFHFFDEIASDFSVLHAT